jgi:oxygen-dependent protoporphyrinogen oxidase
MAKIAIIGGGISGLATAYTLQEHANQSGEEVELFLFEKQDRLGGAILTEKVDDFIVEGGPDCFIIEKPWALKLSKKLGIEDHLLNTNEENKGTFIFSKGKFHPLPEGVMLMVPTKIVPFLSTGLISWSGKIRSGLDLFLPRRTGDSDESLAGFVRRRLGQEVLERIAEPLVGGIHASDPENMSLRSTFPRFLQMEQEHRSLILGMLARRKKMRQVVPSQNSVKRTYFISFIGGMAELTDTLVASLKKTNIQTGCGIVCVKQKKQESGYEIYFDQDKKMEVDAVVLATPAFVTADLVEELDETLAENLREISYASSITVSLAYERSKISHLLKGFGLIIPRIEHRKIMATTWSSLKWVNRAPEGYVLLRVFLGGAYHQEMIQLGDDALLELVRGELKELVGIDAEPLFGKIFRWARTMPQYTVGHLERITELENRFNNYPGIFITGAGYRGVGVPDCIHNAELTADRVMEFLKGRTK